MTALLGDPVSKEHDAGAGHPEWSERFDAALRGFAGLKLMPVPPRAATEDEVALCHTRVIARCTCTRGATVEVSDERAAG